MKYLSALLWLFFSCNIMANDIKTLVSFKTADEGTIQALYYPKGTQAVVLAHGAIFNKESWEDLTKQLVDNGISVLAIDFRGYGLSTAGHKSSALYEDILAGVRYLHQQKNINKVAVLGASMGGKATATAVVQAKNEEINKVILLSPMPIKHPEKLHNNILYIASENEAVVETIKAQFQQVQEPKQLELIKGNAHAQHIFKTEQQKILTNTILKFLLK